MIDKIKENIKREIKKAGTTTGKVCKRMNEDRFFIYRMTDKVQLNKIIRIAEAIGCTAADLLK